MAENTWTTWIYDSTSSTTSGNLTTGVWYAWTSSTSSTTSYTYDPTWTNWLNTTTARQPVYQTYQETPAQRAARELREAEWKEREAARKAEREQAQARAAALLRDHLSKHQRRQLDKHGHFTVHGSEGRRYLIERGTHGNVYCMVRKGRKWVKQENLCIQPGGVPDEDAHLAQKLMIEANEAAFRRTANIHRLLH